MLDVFVKGKFKKAELFQIFVFCTLLVNIWTLINLFPHIPSWLMFLDIWEVIGAISYNLSIVLIEGIFLFMLVMGFGLVIPARFIANRFRVFVVGIALIIALVVISLNFFSILYLEKKLILLIFAVCSGVYYVLITRYEKVWVWIGDVFERVLVLAYFYFGLNGLGVVIVILRNLFA